MTFPLPIIAPPNAIITADLVAHLQAKRYTSGQTWADLTANGNDFYLGADGSATSTDPTYAAGPPSYFSHDGGDYYTLTAAHSGELLRLAGRSDQAFTLEAWVYRGATANTDEALFANMTGSGTSNGFTWLLDYSSNKPAIYAQGSERGAGTAQVGVGAWKHVALTAKFDGTTCTHYLQGAANGTFTYTESSFTSGNSAGTPVIGAFGGGGSTYFQNGTRLSVFRAYSRILTAAEIAKNFAVERSYFGV